MRKLIFYFAIFLLSVKGALAQTDFRDGFIVTLQRDTIFLKIDYRSNSRNYQACVTKVGNETKEYNPGDLLGYGFINDRYFESGVIDNLFVEVLVHGRIDLYRHSSKFYVRKDSEVFLVEQKEIRDEKYSRIDTRWKGILSMLTMDCLTANESIEKMRFDERPITELVIRYNTCVKQPFTVYKEKQPWSKVEMGIVMSITQSTLVIKNTSLSYLNDRYPSIDPTIGLSLAVSTPRLSYPIAFQPEIHLSRARYSSFHVSQNSGTTTFEDTFIEMTNFSIPLMLRYSFPERKYSLKINAGIIADVHLKSDARVIRETVFGGNVYTDEDPVFKFNKQQAGYVAGVSLTRRFPKLQAGLLFRYATLRGLSEEPAPPVYNRKFSLGVIVSTK